MKLLQITGLRAALKRMHWTRGLRAGVAVGLALAVCYRMGYPGSWVALGALQVITVDNGGPYRSRLANIASVLLLGSCAVLVGAVAGTHLPAAVAITFGVCFVITLGRALSQPLASSSVINLVSYIVAFGSLDHSVHAAVLYTRDFMVGALWAAVLSLVLWPMDPFRPARMAVADVYAALAGLIQLVPAAGSAEGQSRLYAAIGRVRTGLERAQVALAITPARMAARTHRARSLTVLNEGADLLLERMLRLAEVIAGSQRQGAKAESVSAEDAETAEAVSAALLQANAWLLPALRHMEQALRGRPSDRGAAFEPGGAVWEEVHNRYPKTVLGVDSPGARYGALFASALEDSMLGVEIGMEAIRAIWSGREPVRSTAPLLRGVSLRQARAAQPGASQWAESLRSNLTLRSVTFRHALRLSVVVSIDVVLMHFTHITHGYWLAMTSLIVLQPYTGETVRRSGQRISGTVAGAMLAAVLAAALPTEVSLLLAISAFAVLTLAVYVVDYAWYCFFLTPTIVLLALPHLRDWHFAAVRVGMTCLGALVAVLAMLLLWPERESLQLPRLLGLAAAAEAEYLRATLAFWQRASRSSAEERLAAERTLLAPARRACGLAANDAEETLDHALIEHAIPLNPARSRTERLNTAALTFTTYVRRVTQTITLLAAAGPAQVEERRVVSTLAARLDGVAHRLSGSHEEAYRPLEEPYTPAGDPQSLTAAQLPRLLRQIGVLENTAREISEIRPA
ncbi:MAG TPA: FUSC family protein [Acidobacteriaceae bacterium]|jgi:uncharacterized membrane protein YccC|nr:FUSC family protein [Acidobacteriaceae bacterium]